MNSKKIFVGVVAGVVASVATGVLLGILFAPKGSDTREKLNRLAGQYGNLAKEKFNKFLDGIIENFEGANGEVSEFTQKGETKLEK